MGHTRRGAGRRAGLAAKHRSDAALSHHSVGHDGGQQGEGAAGLQEEITGTQRGGRPAQRV